MTRRTRWLRSATLLTPALMLAGCAALDRPTSHGLDNGSAALVRQTCSDVMGLGISAESLACGGSLAGFVRAQQDIERMLQAGTDCTRRGATQDSHELAKCAVMQRHAVTPVVAATTSASPLPPAGVPVKHYSSLNAGEQRLRAELSCAQIGLHPAGASFASCVSKLRVAIADVRNWPGT